MNCPSDAAAPKVLRSSNIPVVVTPPADWVNPPAAVTVNVSPVRVTPEPTARLDSPDMSMTPSSAIVSGVVSPPPPPTMPPGLTQVKPPVALSKVRT